MSLKLQRVLSSAPCPAVPADGHSLREHTALVQAQFSNVRLGKARKREGLFQFIERSCSRNEVLVNFCVVNICVLLVSLFPALGQFHLGHKGCSWRRGCTWRPVRPGLLLGLSPSPPSCLGLASAAAGLGWSDHLVLKWLTDMHMPKYQPEIVAK